MTPDFQNFPWGLSKEIYCTRLLWNADGERRIAVILGVLVRLLVS